MASKSHVHKQTAAKTVQFNETKRPTPTERRLRRLELSLEGTRRKQAAWKKSFVVAAVGLFATAAFAAAAITAVTHSYVGYSGEAYSFGESTFTITPTGILLAALPQGSAGTTSGAAVEMAITPGIARETISTGDWYYKVVIAELAVGTLGNSSGTYEAELFLDGVSQGSLFFKQDTGDAAAVESVDLRWNLGTSLPSSSGFVVQVTQV